METLEDRGSGVKWHWDNVQRDLTHAGLRDVKIDPLSTREHFVAGWHSGNPFFLTWRHEQCALLSMRTRDDDLVAALAKVLEYAPLYRYINDLGLITCEWWAPTASPADRLEELRVRQGAWKSCVCGRACLI